MAKKLKETSAKTEGLLMQTQCIQSKKSIILTMRSFLINQ